MRFVPSISPVTTSPDARQVRGLSAVKAVKPVQPRELTVPFIDRQAPHQEAVHMVAQKRQGDVPLEDRRKACRRLSHQPVLEELRSGIDRRHHNLREGDVAEHIDIEA